jgi:hypothetical protein
MGTEIGKLETHWKGGIQLQSSIKADSCQGSDGEEGCSSIDDLMLLNSRKRPASRSIIILGGCHEDYPILHLYYTISFPLQVRSPTGRRGTAHGGIGELDEGGNLISSSFKGSDLIENCATRFDNHEVS